MTGQYALSKQKSDGALLLAAGIDPIYATRGKSTRYLGDGCAMSMVVYLGPEERRRLIAEMLTISPEEIPWQTGLETTVEFQSLPQFDSALLAFVEEQQRKVPSDGGRAYRSRPLTPAKAEQSLPQLELQLNDMRGSDADPIPDPSYLPSRVKWSSSPFNGGNQDGYYSDALIGMVFVRS